jgi:DNA-binding LacI/PurR family transcriptional regulator
VIYIGTFQRGVEWIERHGVPVVVFSGPGSHQCVIDDFAVIRMGAEDLASRGCRRIALMSGDERFTVPEHVAQYAQWRLDAFQDGLASAGAPLVPSLVRQVKATVSTGPWVPDVSPQRTGYDTARRWLALPVDERPDGIVVTDDQMTLGVIAAAQSLGRQVGHDFLIATHANADSATLIGWSERMTLMIVDPAELVAGLFGILESLIDGDSNAETLLKIEPNRFVGDDVPAKLPAAVAEPDC